MAIVQRTEPLANAMRGFGVPVRAVQPASARRPGGVLLTGCIALCVPPAARYGACIVRRLPAGGLVAWPHRNDPAELYADYLRAVAFGIGIQ